MSRAMNVNVSPEEVRDTCLQYHIATTAIEALLPAGTRVVCQTSEGADALRKRLKSRLIEGAVKRSPRFIAPSAMR